MVNDSNSSRGHIQVLFDLSGGEAGDSDDQIRCGGGLPRLVCEARAKFRRAVFAGEYEQIVKCGDLALETPLREPLIESVKEKRRAVAEAVGQESAGDIWRLRQFAGSPITVGTIEPIPGFGGVGGSQSLKNLA